MKEFGATLPQELLNIEDKVRSNCFAWRGQFSPQLIQYLLQAYCPASASVLDPFSGSGTVLHEAALVSLQAYGYEINPAAWIFSKVYEFANRSQVERNFAIEELRDVLETHFPIILFSDNILPTEDFEHSIEEASRAIRNETKTLLNALVILLDLENNPLTPLRIHGKFAGMVSLLRGLPYSKAPITAELRDARALPLDNDSVDFAITSPPYINVFNYHQNYRRSAEALGWDLLRVARSEIGANRGNRGNRFLTVIQYCLDMSMAIHEMHRVLSAEGRAVLIVGYESRVLGVPFYNANIILNIAKDLGLFEVELRQERIFTNRFGKAIREDIVNLAKLSHRTKPEDLAQTARRIASDALKTGYREAAEKDRHLIEDAMSHVETMDGTPIFNSRDYRRYQTRDLAMMVNELPEEY